MIMDADPESGSSSIEESGRFTPRFDIDGLIPCITVDAATGDVLMMAWMNEAALQATLETGIVHYWSRSRQAIWKKGESPRLTTKITPPRHPRPDHATPGTPVPSRASTTTVA